jgi:hypothetical protein
MLSLYILAVIPVGSNHPRQAAISLSLSLSLSLPPENRLATESDELIGKLFPVRINSEGITSKLEMVSIMCDHWDSHTS